MVGECKIELLFLEEKVIVYIDECFVGCFWCVVMLFDDIEVNGVEVKYCDGVLYVSILC